MYFALLLESRPEGLRGGERGLRRVGAGACGEAAAEVTLSIEKVDEENGEVKGEHDGDGDRACA